MDVEKQKASGETTMLIGWGGEGKRKMLAARGAVRDRNQKLGGKWKRTDAIVEPSNS